MSPTSYGGCSVPTKKCGYFEVNLSRFFCLGQSSPNLSVGSSIARQVLELDSRNNRGWLLGCIYDQRQKWGVLMVVFLCCSFCDHPSSGFPFDLWGLARCSVPLGGLGYSLIAPHSTLISYTGVAVPLGFTWALPGGNFEECPLLVTLTPGLCPTWTEQTLVTSICNCVLLCPLTQVVSISSA